MAQPSQAQLSEYQQAVPAPPLRGLVAYYSGYRQQGFPPGRHRGLPSPYLTLIVTLDDPLDIARHADPAAPPGSYPALIGGLHTSPVLITHPGRQSGVQLALHPLGARTLLGMPAGELAGTDVEASAVLGPLAGELRERLQAAPDWPARFAALDRVLLRRAGQPRGVHPAVAQAWRLAVASRGGATVSGLASTAGWSTRHLRSQFLRETGLTPRAAIRVSRFDHARRLLQRRAAAGQPPALADLAADCGYYDQAHLAREFRDLAGQPPSAWLAEEFPFVQALAGGAGQDHGHDS